MTTAPIWLLLITFGGHAAMTPMPSMGVCKAVLQQVMEGNAAAEAGRSCYNRFCYVHRAQCIDGSER